MALKTYNPTSPGRRALVLIDRSELHKGRPEKSLTEGLTKSGGRGAGGRIAVRFRGGGAKTLYRKIDFKRRKFATIIHNVEMKPGKGAQLARSAGAYAQLVGRDAGYAQIRLGSGELRMVLDGCMATVGAVSNPDHMNQNLGKAGRVRHMGWRPHVRGVAMNPIDHPHGGGEGRTSGGRTPVTPWGKDTKGTRTRKNKATDKFIIRTRHVKKAR